MTGVHLNVARDSNTESVLQTGRLIQDVGSYYNFPEVRKQDKFQASQEEENVFTVQDLGKQNPKSPSFSKPK